jgi:A/G-specific adenine glycosylase
VTPYEYIVSEILLQQTQADTVAEFAPGFFQKYTCWSDIDEAGEEELSNSLQPIGLYKQRSRKLKKLASTVLERGDLNFEFAQLIQLPGIGQYIASAAVARFGDDCEPMLDTNSVRVLRRYFDLEVKSDYRRDENLREIAREVVSSSDCLELNWALIDIGRLFCTARSPNHRDCPLKYNCLYYKN